MAAPTSNAQAHLENLRALTDASLTRLDVDTLLVELLRRVRDILDADTAAVLLLDEQSRELVATAACGIEEEVHQRVRVPVGQGFAGHIAETKTPIRLDHVDETTVINPILWEKGIEVMLGVPLLSGGDHVFGVMHVGRCDSRPFSAQDVELLQVVGERVAGAVQARRHAVERAAARLLEESLLPSRFPACAGLEFAARYVPTESHAVGGDWYDVFTLPSGQLWIVVGDVAGHGLPAAVIMGRVRSALRAYTLLELPPETVLELVDRKVRHFEIDTFVTVACAISDPPFDTMTVALAGHPPPVLAVPGRRGALVECTPGPPLGVGYEGGRTAQTVDLPHGSVVVFYTDGLVERREESLDVGLQRLCAAVSAKPPAEVSRDIMRDVTDIKTQCDDVAVVIVRRTEVDPA